MILKQFYLACLAQASYLVGDEQSKRAVVVDPRRDVDDYLAAAAELGLTITDVVLTHFHADFVAGHLALRDRVGATLHLGRLARAGYAFHALAEGDAIDLGGEVRLRVIETPGHTPEGISLIVEERGEPRAALTGDTLFIGDVGRPDLLASVGVTADELARSLHQSLGKLLTLPDAVVVYPGHGAGSLCGRSLGKATASTIGAERSGNYALKPMTTENFIALVTAEQPEAPAYFAHDVALNRSEHAHPVEPEPLDVASLLAAQRLGAQILDVRDATAFAGAHLIDSLNVGLQGQFAMWVGTVIDPRRPVAIISEPGQEREAATRLARIGIDQVVGHLAGGMAALAARPDLVVSGSRMEASELQKRLASPQPPRVIDVRRADEYAVAHIPGSINLPLQGLLRRLDEVPRGTDVVVHCAGGYRSAVAASVLARAGFTVHDLVGGYAAWLAVTTTALPAGRGNP